MSFQNSEGYKATMRLGNLKCGRNPQWFYKDNPYSIENIKRYLLNNNSDTVLLSNEFISSEDILKFQCGCGNKFERSWSSLSQQIYNTCYDCAIKNRGVTKRNSIEEVEKLFISKNLKLLTHDYKGNDVPLECEDKNGFKGYITYNHLLSREGKFEKYSLITNNKYFIHNLNNYARINNIKSKVLRLSDKQLWTHQGIVCQCECGEIFETSYYNFRKDKTRCDKCSNSISHIENLTKLWLEQNNIEYLPQYRIDDCRNVLPLPFDFYLPKYNLLIEVDGQGHYEICYFNNCSKEVGKKSFELTKINDNIKTQYCQDNNIDLLRIPYWEYPNENYKNILSQKLNIRQD